MLKGECIPKGQYHLGIDVWIINSENKILIQKRSAQKKLSPNVWGMTGGSVIKGENSLQIIERETLEELGFVPNTISGDCEEIDCYVLGENNPFYEYTGKCIAVIHRMDEDDDKLIIAPEGKEFSKKEIKELTDFQEKYYKSIILI